MYKTIVVALDCSETSDTVIAALNSLKINDQTKIILSHVLPDANPDREVAPERPQQSWESLYQEVENKLTEYQTAFANSDIEIVSGEPAEEIIRLANIHNANLIMLGNRGLTGFRRVIEGSVSSQVVAEANCSVFVVKV